MYDIRPRGRDSRIWWGKSEHGEQLKVPRRVWFREIDEPYRSGVGIGFMAYAVGVVTGRGTSDLDALRGRDLDADPETEIKYWGVDPESLVTRCPVCGEVESECLCETIMPVGDRPPGVREMPMTGSEHKLEVR